MGSMPVMEPSVEQRPSILMSIIGGLIQWGYRFDSDGIVRNRGCRSRFDKPPIKVIPWQLRKKTSARRRRLSLPWYHAG